MNEPDVRTSIKMSEPSEKKNAYLKHIFWGGLLVAFVVALTIFYFYISSVAKNGIYMDQIRFYAEYVEKIEDGSFQFQDLFNFHSGHLGVGTVLLLLFDVKVLHVNPFFWNCLIPVFLSINFFVLLKAFLPGHKNVIDLVFSLILATIISILLFGLGQWEVIEFSWGLIIHVGNALTVISFFLLSKMLLDPKFNWRLALTSVLLIGFDILMFMGGYSFPLLAAAIFVLAVYFIDCKIRKAVFDKKKWIPFAVLVLFALIAVIVLAINGSSVGKGFDFVAFIQSFVLAQASIPFGSCDFYVSGDLNILFLAGSVMLLIYAGGVFLLFWHGRFRTNWFPLFLMAFSQIAAVVIAFSRYGYSIRTPGSSRYYATYILGYIAVVWVYLDFLRGVLGGIKLSLTKPPVSKKVIASLGVLATVILACFRIGSDQYEFFAVSGSRGSINQSAVDYALFSNDLSPAEAEVLYQAKYSDITKCFGDLRKYDLYIFRSEKTFYTSDLETTKKYRGFYEQENDFFWLSQKATFGIKPSQEGEMSLEFYVPEKFGDNKVTIYLNGSSVANVNLIAGEMTAYQCHLDTDSYYFVDLHFDHAINPWEKWDEADQRNLSATLKTFAL